MSGTDRSNEEFGMETNSDESSPHQETLVVCQEDYGTDSSYSGFGVFIHLAEDGCEQAPEVGRIVFDVRDGGGSADLCPNCDWPDWVRSLRSEDDRDA